MNDEQNVTEKDNIENQYLSWNIHRYYNIYEYTDVTGKI